MSLTKRNFEEEFERDLLDTERYLIAQQRIEELFWFEQLAKEQYINNKPKINKYGKFTKKNTKGIYKKLSKRYEKSRSSKNYE